MRYGKTYWFLYRTWKKIKHPIWSIINDDDLNKIYYDIDVGAERYFRKNDCFFFKDRKRYLTESVDCYKNELSRFKLFLLKRYLVRDEKRSYKKHLNGRIFSEIATKWIAMKGEEDE